MASESSIQGVAELSAKLKELADPKKYGRELANTVKAAMRPALKQARANIAAISPGVREVHKLYTGMYVHSGFAARNIKLKGFTSRDKTMAAAILGPSREAFYASQFFELGTSKLPKHEWLVPAFEAQKDDALQLVAKALRKRIDSIARKRYGNLTRP